MKGGKLLQLSLDVYHSYKVCAWCDNPIYHLKHHSQKYCSDICAKRARNFQVKINVQAYRERIGKDEWNEQCRIYMQNYRKRWGWKNKNIKGTGGPGPHTVIDKDEKDPVKREEMEDRERDIIKGELKAIGLR